MVEERHLTRLRLGHGHESLLLHDCGSKEPWHPKATSWSEAGHAPGSLRRCSHSPSRSDSARLSQEPFSSARFVTAQTYTVPSAPPWIADTSLRPAGKRNPPRRRSSPRRRTGRCTAGRTELPRTWG